MTSFPILKVRPGVHFIKGSPS
ncbi:MAG: hypothetical protein JCHSAcid_06910 [uncultured Acidilobus sp. JCHS]|jgi:hypothetical protein|nr:MAG: hypothetical protein OSP8Acid_14400 [uncultured Acidilobus sp. OSP8]ESQ25754.1 MAG: hypothetical protein JCHSAcid_06910 [uncultured Acidilobus sp. JCHS]